jgi:hypothetical protein
LTTARDFVNRAEQDGYRLVVVPANIARRLKDEVDVTGAPIVDLRRFREQWNESFSFTWVPPDALTDDERAIFDRIEDILALRGGRPSSVREVAISSTMRISASGYAETSGVWESREGRIVVKRDQLASFDAFAGTLLHEVAHAVSGTSDVSEAFEDALTSELGSVAERALSDLNRT